MKRSSRWTKIFSVITVLAIIFQAYPCMKAKTVLADTLAFCIQVSRDYVTPGEIITLTVSIPEGMEGIEGSLLYDTSKLDYVSYEEGEALDDIVYKKIFPQKEKGRINLVAVASENTISAGNVLCVRLKVKENVSGIAEIGADDVKMCPYVDGKEVGNVIYDSEVIDNNGNEISGIHIASSLNGISLNKSEIILDKGTSEKLEIIYDPEDAQIIDEAVWSSSDETVASVDNEGNVVAINCGTALITVKVGSYTASCSVEVQESGSESFYISKDNVVIHRGEYVDLDVVYDEQMTPDEKKITWSSSDENVATVDEKGRVTAKEIGYAIITARDGEMSADCAVTVDVPLLAIETPSEIKMAQNQKWQIEYSFVPEDTTDSKEVIFVSADSMIADVDEQGIITAKNTGTTEIRIIGSYNVTAVISVTVMKEVPIEQLEINYASASLKKNQTLKLTVEIIPENTTDDKKIIWRSSNSNVATVDQNGVVTGKNKGTALITAESVNGKTAECIVEVVNTKLLFVDQIDKAVHKMYLIAKWLFEHIIK